jgi:hypothetical protein
MFESKPETTATIQKLYDKLCALSVGSILVWPDARRIAGAEIQHKQRWLMSRAIDRAEKDCGCIFESVRGVGVKRLHASDAPEVGLHAIRGVRRKARRGAKRLERIKSNSLSDGERKRVIAYGSLLGAIGMMADGNKARTLAAVADPAKVIPPKDILQMFNET